MLCAFSHHAISSKIFTLGAYRHSISAHADIPLRWVMKEPQDHNGRQARLLYRLWSAKKCLPPPKERYKTWKFFLKIETYSDKKLQLGKLLAWQKRSFYDFSSPHGLHHRDEQYCRHKVLLLLSQK